MWYNEILTDTFFETFKSSELGTILARIKPKVKNVSYSTLLRMLENKPNHDFHIQTLSAKSLYRVPPRIS